jgi:hypothetical protein
MRRWSPWPRRSPGAAAGPLRSRAPGPEPSEPTGRHATLSRRRRPRPPPPQAGPVRPAAPGARAHRAPVWRHHQAHGRHSGRLPGEMRGLEPRVSEAAQRAGLGRSHGAAGLACAPTCPPPPRAACCARRCRTCCVSCCCWATARTRGCTAKASGRSCCGGCSSTCAWAGPAASSRCGPLLRAVLRAS